MKHTHIIITASLLLTACSRHDANDVIFRKQILGTWKQSAPGSTMTFSADGRFSVPSQNPKHPEPYTGNWQISDGVLILTPSIPGGRIEHSKIVRLDNHQMFSDDNGVTLNLKR